MNIRKFIITMVINIFLMYLVTILYEYINLTDRFSALEQTIDTAVESSVDASMGAEELFASSKREGTSETSYGVSKNKTVNNSLIVVSKTGTIHNINIYTYAYYFNTYLLGNKNHINTSDAILNNMANSKVNTAFAFSYVYGNVGSVWKDSGDTSNLQWAKTSQEIKNTYASKNFKQHYKITAGGSYTNSGTATNDRTPTADFKEFYDSVGKLVTSKKYVRKKNVDTFKLVIKENPVLLNMGLSLDADNKANALATMQNYLSSYKIGKSNSGVTNSVYYLTPYSLGVTYIPTKILYPTLLNSINTTVAFNKISGGESDSKHMDTGYVGCIDEDPQYKHKRGVNDGYIINDGNIEYDMNSLNVSVDYVAIDFKDWKTNATLQQIIRRIEGSVQTARSFSSGDADYKSAEAILGANFNKVYADGLSDATVRIVARVTAQIKVHVPYQCALLKYNCLRYTGGSDSEHFDIKDYNSSTGEYRADSTGLWYEYTTYRCHAR